MLHIDTSLSGNEQNMQTLKCSCGGCRFYCQGANELHLHKSIYYARRNNEAIYNTVVEKCFQIESKGKSIHEGIATLHVEETGERSAF